MPEKCICFFAVFFMRGYPKKCPKIGLGARRKISVDITFRPLLGSSLLITVTSRNKVFNFFRKKTTEVNGTVRDMKSLEDDDVKLEDEFPPVSAAIRQNVHPPVPIPSNPVPSTVSSIAKLNGKTKKASILITFFHFRWRCGAVVVFQDCD